MAFPGRCREEGDSLIRILLAEVGDDRLLGFERSVPSIGRHPLEPVDAN